MRFGVLALILVAACGRIGFDAQGAIGDGGPRDGTLGDSSVDSPSDMIGSGITYVKASNTDANDQFGRSVALSADGTTLVVGAFGEDSAATTINGNQADDSAVDAGAVYVFVRSGDTWTQEAYLKASNAQAGDFFGIQVRVSDTGSRIAVTATGEDSGIVDNPADNSLADAGAVYVFERSGTTWTQQAYLKAANLGSGDGFGLSLALTGTGKALVVGAVGEDGSIPGVNGTPNELAAESGAAYLFTFSGSGWSQQAYFKASNVSVNDTFGISVAVASDGKTIAVGAEGENSAAFGIDGDQNDNTAFGAGATYVFTTNGTTWSQQAYVKASNTESNDRFGEGVALSDDGNVLAVGAYGEENGEGAIYVFGRLGPTWTQQVLLKASNRDPSDSLGTNVAMSSSGKLLVTGATWEDSAARGTGGAEGDNSAMDSGAAYVFGRSGTAWSQGLYLKASNTEALDYSGSSVAVSADGTCLAVAAPNESSSATGINGDGANNAAPVSGAVYVYR